jgi:hypothetical protein
MKIKKIVQEFANEGVKISFKDAKKFKAKMKEAYQAIQLQKIFNNDPHNLLS